MYVRSRETYTVLNELQRSNICDQTRTQRSSLARLTFVARLRLSIGGRREIEREKRREIEREKRREREREREKEREKERDGK